MAYYNLPPVLSTAMDELDKRLRRLETAIRFSAPAIATDPTNPKSSDIIYNTTSNLMKYWNGTSWITLADNNGGTPIITFTPTWSGTGLTYTGTPATGQYMKIGKLIHFNIQVNCATVTNFGTGQYSITLPTGLAPAYRYIVNGGILKGSNSATWNLEGIITSGSTTITMAHPTSNGGLDVFSASKPINLSTADNWFVAGQYFIA